ncbi:hypothetical protein HAINFHK1212_1253 [Haemophilus influenzae HK1212]|uniref:Uncharacterized protein n=1 Tax=Haemophilus influenzae HK1212 TaxID=456482 RepID=A0A7G2K155_HAEIF|nr:hypothetical protein HAINFHK1212_1253 [Haemophilus influenzae HK1212]
MKKLTTKPFTRRTLAYLLILAFYTSWGYAVEEDELLTLIRICNFGKLSLKIMN